MSRRNYICMTWLAEVRKIWHGIVRRTIDVLSAYYISTLAWAHACNISLNRPVNYNIDARVHSV